MELKLYLRMIRNGWWIVLLAAFSAVNVALVVDYFTPPTYQAVARLVLIPNTTIVTTQNLVNSLATLDRPSIVNTYSEVLNSTYLYKDTLQQFNLTEEQRSDYTQLATVMPDSNIIELSVTGPDPQICADWANSVVDYAIKFLNNTYQVYQLSYLDKAVPNFVAINPVPVRDVSLALVLGLLFGALLAIVREQIRMPMEERRMLRMLDGNLGCFNRTHIEQVISDEAVKARESSEDYLFSTALINFESLVEYRNVLPPQIFDDLLRQVVKILNKELRGNDSVGRWDELSFMVVLPNTHYQASERVLNKIRWDIHKELMIPETDIPLDFIFGVTRWQSNDTLTNLLERLKSDMETNRYRPLKEPELPRKPGTTVSQSTVQ